MAYRYSKSITVAILLPLFFAQAAPSFKFHKSFVTSEAKRYAPPRAERRLMSGASPIHYITPFMGSMDSLSHFFAPSSALGNPASSSVYKLPLRLFSNGKPHAVFPGFPKPLNGIHYLPRAVSNIIQLPLKYFSNAKPVGVYFKDSSFNYL